MKTSKFISATTAAILFTSPVAFAKDEESHNHNFTLSAANIDVDQSYGDATYLGSDSGTFFGIEYAYNFKLSDNIFIKPGFTFYLSDLDIKDTDGTDDKSTLSSISNIIIDFGYSKNQFSYYAIIGATGATYERSLSGYSSKASDSGLTYGAGISYDIKNNLGINLEYQATALEYESVGGTNYEVNLNNISLGLTYKF